MKRIIPILFLLMCIINVRAQEIIVSAKVDTVSALIGQPIKIKVQVSQPRSVNIDWNETDSLDQLEIIARSAVDTIKTTDPNLLLRSQTYTVSAYDSGKYVIPSFVFKYKSQGSTDYSEASSDPLAISYFLVPVDTTKEIRDILPVVDVPIDWYYVLMIVGICLLIILIVFLLYRYIKKRNSKKVVADIPEEIRRPAHEIAIEALQTLDAEKQWQQGNVKYYHTTLTDIIRQYIFNRWNVNAMEFTSYEILQHGFISLISQEQKELLTYMLRLADLVKFAKAQPIANEHEQCMRSAIQFVEGTTFISLNGENKTEKEVVK